MGDPSGIQNEKVDKASKWTVFLLVDLKTVFIIVFVYVSIVNLIATTANNEANSDVNCKTNTFTVSSQPGHQNVTVEFIDDAVLWNCRDHSVTKSYYKHLYGLLIGSFALALVSFAITKVTILCASVHGYTYLWHVAVARSIRKARTVNLVKNNANTVNKVKEAYRMLKLPTDGCTDDICGAATCRMASLVFNSLILPFAIFITATTYDLHPFSCIAGPGEQLIEYNEATKTVEIRYRDGIVIYQLIAGITVALLWVMFAINIYCFYWSNFNIVKKLENLVNVKLVEKLEEELTDEDGKADEDGNTGEDGNPGEDGNTGENGNTGEDSNTGEDGKKGFKELVIKELKTKLNVQISN